MKQGPIVYSYTHNQLNAAFAGHAVVFCGEKVKLNGLSILLQQASNIEIYIEARPDSANILALKFLWRQTISDRAEMLIFVETDDLPGAPEKLRQIILARADEQTEFVLPAGFVRLEESTKGDYYLEFQAPNNYYLVAPEYMLLAVRRFLEGEISLCLLERRQKAVVFKALDGVITAWQVLPERIRVKSNHNVLILLNSQLAHVHSTVVSSVNHVFRETSLLSDMVAQTSLIDAKKDY